MSKRIDSKAVPTVTGSGYPAPFHLPCMARARARLGEAAQLVDFGVNLLHLPPGAWSSQRHWHTQEDEFVYVLEGEVVLVTEAGEELLRSGDCAGFKAGVADGHHLQNRSARAALVLEIGSRKPGDEAHYPDIDLHASKPGAAVVFTHRDGRPYPKR